ncbi:DoxX family protein [Arthrobacter cupressi]|nr:DoxX family protein [Arthrobacter cupressi]NYD79025.1 putative oxidoreductase [Arthrobacter cupressi]
MSFLNPSPAAAAHGTALLRICAGALMLLHGVQKLLAGQEAFEASIAGMGVQKAEMLSWLVIAGETGLGAMLLVGALTRLAGFLAAMMFAAIWFVTESGKPLLAATGGIAGELLIVYVVVSLAFVFLGAGSASLDRKMSGVRFSGLKTPAGQRGRR